MSKSKQSGFTIIELLIATLVFSLVLVLITVSVLTFTKSYFRGINQAATQTAARTIVEGIAQSIQFSGDAVNPAITPNPNGSSGFCIGNQRYSFLLGWQLVDGTPNSELHQTTHSLMLDASSSCSGATAQDVRSGNLSGTELLSPRMRLAKLKIEQAGDPSVWRVTIRVVFGDDDLLCSPSVPGDCASSATSSPLDKPDLSCKVAFTGSQYCAASELSTVVKKRITSSQ
jgi:prepilin-type N-terminal cleavage/methylation domain-containing protein